MKFNLKRGQTFFWFQCEICICTMRCEYDTLFRVNIFFPENFCAKTFYFWWTGRAASIQSSNFNCFNSFLFSWKLWNQRMPAAQRDYRLRGEILFGLWELRFDPFDICTAIDFRVIGREIILRILSLETLRLFLKIFSIARLSSW